MFEVEELESMEKKIVIIGAGPTGLGAVYRLRELGYRNWSMYEKNNYVGGLSASFKDNEGFTWDIGGHVMFSHYEYFDELIDKILGNGYLEHLRKAWIWVLNRWVPYPFQNNIKDLPRNAVLKCVMGLIEVQREDQNCRNFKEWILKTFGPGIAMYFMFPHNRKIWAHPLEAMDKNWIAERISVINIERVLRNIIYDRDDVGWGPNARFKFPLFGGTGGLFQKFIPYIKDHLYLEKEAVKIDIERKEIIFADKDRTNYDILINTMPLDQFVKRANLKQFTDIIKDLKHNSVFIVGVGFKKKCPSDKCWMYFPGDDSPFYRVTYFSNYSPNNVPDDDYYSLMAEIAYSEFRNVSKDTVIEETIQGMINTRLISVEDRNKIVTKYLIDVPFAYPIPTLKRDKVLQEIQPYLMQRNIYSRGRFGAWKYEIGNMDHSFMMGVQCVGSILNGENEEVFKSG